MEAGFTVVIILIAAVCIGIGYCLGKNAVKPIGLKGALNVVYDNQTNEPFLYLESYVPVTEITTQKTVILDVKIIR